MFLIVIIVKALDLSCAARGNESFEWHKFKHNFQDCVNPICSCGLDIESTSHILLHRPTFNDERYTLLSPLNKIDCKLLELTKSSLS